MGANVADRAVPRLAAAYEALHPEAAAQGS